MSRLTGRRPSAWGGGGAENLLVYLPPSLIICGFMNDHFSHMISFILL